MLTDLSANAEAASSDSTTHCYHCGLDIPDNINIAVTLNFQRRAFCCPACKTVFELITAGGLANYYEYRSAFANKPADKTDSFSEFDNSGFQQSFCRTNADGSRQALLYIDDLHCAACVWLIEKGIGKLPGINSIDVSLVDNAAQLDWSDTEIRLSQIVDHIHKLGYRAAPWKQDTQHEFQQQAERSLLRRTGLAGIVMMQVGMFSIALYAGGDDGMAAEHKHLLHGFAALLTTPVLLYSAQGFFAGAWRSLKQLRVNMDVPIALALGIAWTASMLTVLRGQGEVYFDSVCMFVFLLSGVRYLELRARNKFTSLHNQGSLPTSCKCFADTDASEYTYVGLHDLNPGQIIYVHQGETVPIDGRLLDDTALLNEASIHGEFLPVEKKRGDLILSGAINQSSGLKLQVEKAASDSCLQNLQRLALRSRSRQPPFLKLSDRVAQYFSLTVLLLTASASAAWYLVDASRTIEIAIAMLVISCPCALSLAAPTAFTVAINSLRKQGVLVCDSLVFEKLSKLSLIAFDKTGTLTEGKFVIRKAHYFTDIQPDKADALAKALEQWSAHPIAHAFTANGTDSKSISDVLQNVELIDSKGLQAQLYDDIVRIGNKDFCAALGAVPVPEIHTQLSSTCIWLANSHGWLACYELQDSIRAEARQTLSALKQQTLILSGDNEPAVASVAHELGIENYFAACSPQAKLDVLQHLQTEQHHTVLMVGDGVNDLPVLAQADISVAMNSANHLAQVQADCVLLGNQLSSLLLLFQKAAATWRVVKQNISWALFYNFTALPLAALGFVPPWVAALGMSVSSLVVILNAGRLNRTSH